MIIMEQDYPVEALNPIRAGTYVAVIWLDLVFIKSRSATFSASLSQISRPDYEPANQPDPLCRCTPVQKRLRIEKGIWNFKPGESED